jgi:RNA polymerase sigma-70 factor, ECF subfamily
LCPRLPLLGCEEFALADSRTRREPTNPIDEPVAELIRWKARTLIGRAGFTAEDRRDLEQELTLRLLSPLSRYDPTRGERLVYAQVLVDRVAANILRDQQRLKRAGGPVASLDQPLGGDDPSDLVASVGGRERDAVGGTTPRSDEELQQLALDVASVLERLPDDVRAIAVGLMTESLAALARRLGVPRSTLRDRVQGLRERLGRGNLDEY